MQLTCQQSHLRHGLSTVAHALSSSSTLPILTCILMEASADGVLQLTTTNLKLFITSKVEGAQISEPGIAAIPARLLIDLISALPAGEIELCLPEVEEIKRPTLTLTSIFGETQIRCMDASEFPSRPQADERTTVEIEATQLKGMIRQVAFAAATDESRPVFTAMLMRFNGERLTVAAADAFRLATQDIPFPVEEAWEGDLLVPARTLSELAKLLPSEGTVEISASPLKNLVVFETETLTLGSRLIEGQFPNYRQIIPQSHETRAVIDTKLFATLAHAVAPFATQNGNIVRLSLIPSADDGLTPGLLRCEAHAEDVGSTNPAVPVAVTGTEQKIILNIRYLVETLAVIDTPEVVLEITSAQRPCVLHPINNAQITHVIMPMTSNR